VRRFDSLGRRYFLDVAAGRRVRRDAWELDVERRRAERGDEPRPRRAPTETHPLGRPERGERPFPPGVSERGIPQELPAEVPDEPEPVEDEADYDEGSGT
jgi:hypothetical protein